MSPHATARIFHRRISEVRDRVREANLHAFVVTHTPNLRYLTGFNGSSGFVVLTADACVLSVDFRYATAAREMLDARQDATISLDVTDRRPDENIVAVLQHVVLEPLSGNESARIGIEAASMTVNRFTRLSAALADAAPSPLAVSAACPVLVQTERMVERSRVVKDTDEIATLREAGRRLSEVARQLRSFARPGMSEREVAGEIDWAMRRAGFDRPAFETIVASGPNGALPHARPGPRTLREGEGVVLDFGGVYDGYCVDLTRTLHLGEPGVELRRIFRAVAEAHAAAIAAVRAGVLPGEIDGAARCVLERHGLGEAFGHGTGHGLGLEVHEEPRIARAVANRTESPVTAGMVFTIEPGAYVAGLGGVRIEDDVLVVEGGCELLTDVPVEL